MKAILKKAVRAEDHTLPVGTVCEVEKTYDDSVDLMVVVDGDTVLFWMRREDIELN